MKGFLVGTLKNYFSLNFFASKHGLSHSIDVNCEGVGGHLEQKQLVLGYQLYGLSPFLGGWVKKSPKTVSFRQG